MSPKNHLSSIAPQLTRSILALLLASCCRVLAVDELDALLAQATSRNPSVEAARLRVRQQIERQRELFGFFDPRLTASAGRTQRNRGIPGSTISPALTNDAAVIQGGVELAVRPGAYISFGVAERLLTDPGQDYSHMYQTLVGVALEIPLNRDRGFREWGYDRARATAIYGEAVSGLLAVTQQLRHDVEQSYVGVQESVAAYRVAREATERFRILLEEAQELARLKVIPEYQILPAQMELELRREEELNAKRAHEASLVRLGRLVGRDSAVTLKSGHEILVSWAGEASIPDVVVLSEVLRHRGSYGQILSLIKATETDLARSREEQRSDLSFRVGATWQGEDPHQPLGTSTILSDKHLGGAAMVVWTRPLGFRGERAAVGRHRARLAELREQLRTRELQIAADLATARIEFDRASARLELVNRAVVAAQKTLEAEQERFRLGEGRSRYVLDAQKDLTQILQRRTRTAGAMLRAYSDLLFASGYKFVDGPGTTTDVEPE